MARGNGIMVQENTLRDLYQEVILDHNRSPKNFRTIPEANHTSDGVNPLCGDTITIYAKVNNGIIEDVSFQGSGCAISKASASLMTEHIKGKTVEEFETLYILFHSMVTLGKDPDERLGKTVAMDGVRKYPSRVKCATLSWHTFQNAIKQVKVKATTE